jgi:hypothetical protein
MCNTKGHQHWCSGCGNDLNKVPKDSYIEIEWSQNEHGQIVEEKSMICNSCLEDSENISELDKFFSELKYSPFGHIFCSSCKKDLTKEVGKKIKSGIDYECLNFKCHERSGPNIKHIIKVVVLCKDCIKTDFNAENLAKLKKLGKNPKFAPMVTCDKIDVCKQYKSGGKDVNCSNIVIGRDRESLEIAILCGRKHKGALPLPFDDGTSIVRPRKRKGAAMANPQTFPIVAGMNPIQDYLKEIEKLFKRHKLGVYGDSRLLAIEDRLTSVEKALGINGRIVRAEICEIRKEFEFEPSDTDPDQVKISSGSVDVDKMDSIQMTDTIPNCGNDISIDMDVNKKLVR